MLKTSIRIRDRAEAQALFKKLIDRTLPNEDILVFCLGNLCDLLLEELSINNDPEILDEITPLIAKTLDIAEEANSYYWLAETKLLQAKLALIQMKIEEAKRLMIQAQRIADLHGLNSLASRISSEHDKLLEQVDVWDTVEKEEAPISERIKLASTNGVLERIQGKRAVESPELIDDVPMLLAIISKTGYMVLTNPFSVEIPFDEDRVGEFISFFNSISGQMFSKSLDRAKFGEYTLLLKTLNSFSFCYLFEGQSYLAQKRLNNFYETIKSDGSILEILNTAIHIGQVINLKENPKLETMIAKCFLSDQQKFQVTAEKEEVHKLIKRSRRIRKQRATRKQRVSKIVITEILIEIVSLLLFLTSHFLFLGYIGKLEAAWIVPGEKGFLVYVDLTFYLGIGGHLIVLTIMIISWLNETVKNIWIKAEILVQIAALGLFLAAQLLYLSFLGFLPRLNYSDFEYGTIIDIPFYIGIACQLIVVVLILYEYMKHFLNSN